MQYIFDYEGKYSEFTSERYNHSIKVNKRFLQWFKRIIRLGCLYGCFQCPFLQQTIEAKPPDDTSSVLFRETNT